MWAGRQSRDSRGTKLAAVSSCSSFHLFPCNRPHVRDLPADAGECLHHRDHKQHEECEVDQPPNQAPEGSEEPSNPGDVPKQSRNNCTADMNQYPTNAENDRLHGVKANKGVVFFQNVKNDATHEWDAGNRRSHVRGQTG